ncbi:MAG: helix-turn-helix domain-containing protein [bacterium]|nr:helix-turn-helix domain-containing protein [bacterium]
MSSPLGIVVQPAVREIFDHFAACFGVRVMLYSPYGQYGAIGGEDRPPGHFCDLVQHHLFSKDQCHSLDRSKLHQAMVSREIVRYECPAGLVGVIRPAFLDEKLLGFFMIAEIRIHEALPAWPAREWQTMVGDPSLIRAYESIQHTDPGNLDHIIGIFSALVDSVLSRRLISLRSDMVLDRIVEYLSVHVDKPVALTDVATAVGRSPSSISHMLRKRLHTSFKQLQIETRLQRAEEYLRTYPDMTVQEASWRVGYNDAFYFSRLYKRYRGESPSAYRKKHSPPPL